MHEQKTTQEEAQALRENLRNERRISGNQGSPSASQSRGSSNAPFGSDSQDLGADSSRSVGNTEDARSLDRSAKGKPERGGQDSRRSFNDGGSSANRGSETPRYSGLERADPIPEMPVKRGPGRPRKEQVIDTAAQVKKAIFKKATVLTEKEASEYKKPLMSALQSYGEYYDKYIRWRTQQPDMTDIWGNITDFEAEAMANIMIRRGMRNAQAAEAVRAMINGEDYVSVGVMFVPRVMATVEEMKKVPPKPKKRRGRRESID